MERTFPVHNTIIGGQVMTNTPIAGFDVSKHFSEMCILSPDNKVFLRMKFNHNMTDFRKVCDVFKKVEKEFSMKPSIIMEATGHYHRLPFYFFKNAGYNVIVVNPIQTDSIKNITVRKVKNDKIDAYRIALLYRLQELNPTNLPVDAICDLRNLCRHYYDLMDSCTAQTNVLIALTDELFPGFQKIFGKISSKTALKILSIYPTPDTIVNADQTQLIEIIASTSRKNLKWAKDKYDKLIRLASEAQPIFIKHASSLVLTSTTVNLINTLQSTIRQIETMIKAVISDNPSTIGEVVKLLCSIPGIDTLSAASILGEIGDFKAFKSPKQLVAFCGIDPTQKDSGQFKSSRNKMSKRGSSYLRRVLYIAALNSISTKQSGELNNPVLHEYYHKKIISKPKMSAIGAVMHKLVYIIFAVLRDGKPFEIRTPEEHAKMLKQKSQKLVLMTA
jgi:transposase